MTPAPIRMALAHPRRSRRQTLLVRKRGSDALMQPGGKIDIGEASHQALLRELGEERGFWVASAARAGIARVDAARAGIDTGGDDWLPSCLARDHGFPGCQPRGTL